MKMKKALAGAIIHDALMKEIENPSGITSMYTDGLMFDEVEEIYQVLFEFLEKLEKTFESSWEQLGI